MHLTSGTYSDEQALIRALKAGDKRACAELVRRYSRPLYRVVLRILGSPEEAEEALQETFISACDKIATFREDAKLSTWLYRIATNTALMRLRREKENVLSLDPPVETKEGHWYPEHLADWRFDPHQVVLTRELRQVLEEAIQKLPETLRTVFVLRELEGLSTAETAQVLGISETATKVRLHRARLLLREWLSPYLAEVTPRKATGDGATDAG